MHVYCSHMLKRENQQLLQVATARAWLEYVEKEADLEKQELKIRTERKILDERRALSEADARVNIMESMMKESSQAEGDHDSLSSIKAARSVAAKTERENICAPPGGRVTNRSPHATPTVVRDTQTQPIEVCANIRPNDQHVINIPGLDDTGVSESDGAEAELMDHGHAHAQQGDTQTHAQQADSAQTSAVNRENNGNNMEFLICQTFQFCQESMKTMQSTLTAALGGIQTSTTNTLTTAMSKLTQSQATMPTAQQGQVSTTTASVNGTLGQYGVLPQTIKNHDKVSPEIRAQILSGQDVNLNVLLIPNYESDKKLNKRS